MVSDQHLKPSVASKGIEPLPPDPNSGILSIELRSQLQK
jgi:hypothetical protein